jgi:hypothetical protein
MKLQAETDFIVVKKGGYFDGRRTLQQMGNLVVTKKSMILNVMLTSDAMKTHFEQSGDYKGNVAWTPVGKIKNSVSDLKVATKDTKASMAVAKESFRLMKEMGVSAGIIETIAAESSDLDDFETRVAAMGADNPKSFHIPLKDITNIKMGFIGPMKVTLKNGTVLKMFAMGSRKKVKNFLSSHLSYL